MNPEAAGDFGMRIVGINHVQDNADILELTFSKVYLSDLKAKLYLRKNDINNLGLRLDKEISLCVRPGPITSEAENPMALINGIVKDMSVKRARNGKSRGLEEFLDYMDIEISFNEFNKTGNLPLRKEHTEMMGITSGDVVFLMVLPVKH